MTIRYDARWVQIQRLIEVRGHTPPRAFVDAVAALVEGDDSHEPTMWPEMVTSGSTTRWACWTVTDTELGRIEIDYPGHAYDQSVENRCPRSPSRRTEWKRLLAEIIAVRRADGTEGRPRLGYPTEPIEIVFAGDQTVRIPQDGDLTQSQRWGAHLVFSKLEGIKRSS
jgi:hypothetical protein